MINNTIKKKILIIISLCTIMITLFSCKKSNNIEATKSELREIKEEEIVYRDILTNGVVREKNTNESEITSVKLGDGTSKSVVYSANNLIDDYDDAAAIYVNMSDESLSGNILKGNVKFVDDSLSIDSNVYGVRDIELKAGGTYILSGEINGGQIRIIGERNEKIRIILDEVKINTKKDYAIFSDSDCEVIITLKDESENYIITNDEIGSNKFFESAIFTHNSLCINGRGSLIIGGRFKTAIDCRDVLSIMSGKFFLASNEDCIKANTSIIIRDGEYNINSFGSAIVSTSEINGMIFIEGGYISIDSGACGLSSNDKTILVDGNINVNSKLESIRSKTVDIVGGNASINSGNNGISAFDLKQSFNGAQDGVYLRIAGGDIDIDSWRDGLESYGDMILEGGKLYIGGPILHSENILAYKGNITLKGIDMVALGASKNVQDLGDASSQNYIIVYYSGKHARPKGSAYQVVDDADNIIMMFTPEKDYRVAIITSDKLKLGNKYTLISRDEDIEINLNEKITIIKQ